MRSAWAALLLLALLGGPAGAEPLQEVVLSSGRTLQAREAERRDGRWHLVLTSGLSMSLPVGEVSEVRRLEAPARSTELNVVRGGRAEVRPEPVEGLGEGDRELLARVEGLRASRRWSAAEAVLREELVARPGDDLRLVLLGRVLVDADRFGEALEPLGLASPAPDSSLRRERDLARAEALSRLGRVDEALASLSRTPRDAAGEVSALRARLERDRSAGANLEELGTSRFLLRLPENGVGRPDVQPLLRLLDEAWDELQGRLGGAPRERVVVLIQPGDEFWETTGMGRNVGGLYDGKVRVPAGRLDPPAPRLAAVLRHELTHAFVDALTGGRADAAWHEGIAEHFEGSRLDAALERRLAAQ